MLADHIGIPQIRDLASRSEQYTESIRVGSLSRLAELLYPESDQEGRLLDVSIEFAGGRKGFPEIRGRVEGALELLCQRCLGPLSWQSALDFRLVVVGNEADLEFVSEPFDAVISGETGICLMEIVEDELLSSLPLAPMHADEENCDPSGDVEIVAADDEPAEGEMNKPFGDLAAMLKAAESPGEKN
jgi:uncharacterized protein